MIFSNPILISLLFGFIPVFIWLLFWLYEDKQRPEPRAVILRALIGGMLVVPLTIPIQQFGFNTFSFGISAFVIVSISEEVLKFLAAYILVLRSKENNEPLDAVIYMITVALGFSAVENSLFLIQEAQFGAVIPSLVITGNMRFIGATLLHLISSATVGVAMSLAFYKSKKVKRLAIFFGLFLAVILHTTFNLLIIQDVQQNIFTTFMFVWVGVVVLLLLFEKIKNLTF